MQPGKKKEQGTRQTSRAGNKELQLTPNVVVRHDAYQRCSKAGWVLYLVVRVVVVQVVQQSGFEIQNPPRAIG